MQQLIRKSARFCFIVLTLIFANLHTSAAAWAYYITGIANTYPSEPNNSGQFILYPGGYCCDSPASLYTRGGGITAIPYPPQYDSSLDFGVRSISNTGLIGAYVGNELGYRGLVLDTKTNIYKDIGHLPGHNASMVNNVNDKGEVAGTSLTFVDGIYSPFIRGFVYSPQNGMQEIGTLNGQTSQGFDLNNNGFVVGLADTYYGLHSYIYSSQTGIIDITPNFDSWPFAINDLNQVVGGDWGASGFLYTPGEGAYRFVERGLYFRPKDINNSSVIVGEAAMGFAAMYTEEGGLVDLNSLLPEWEKTHWKLQKALGINDLGEITGIGLY